MTRDELHELYRQQLPPWGRNTEGTLVEVLRTEGDIRCTPGERRAFYGWQEGPCEAPIAEGCPEPWGPDYIVAILTEDRSTWSEVPAEEWERLGKHLIGCRAWACRGTASMQGYVTDVVAQFLWIGDGNAPLSASPLRVHPDDLTAAREKAGPTPPATWDEWEEGKMWVDSDGDSCVKRDGALFLSSPDWPDWREAVPSESYFRIHGPFRAPTEDEMLRARHADELSGWVPPTSPDGWRDGDTWARHHSHDSVLYRKDGERLMRLESDGWCLAYATPAEVDYRHLRPLTAEERAQVEAADEAARVPEEPTGDVLALDQDGHPWTCWSGEWGSRGICEGMKWADLHREYGPLTVYRREES